MKAFLIMAFFLGVSISCGDAELRETVCQSIVDKDALQRSQNKGCSCSVATSQVQCRGSIETKITSNQCLDFIVPIIDRGYARCRERYGQ